MQQLVGKMSHTTPNSLDGFYWRDQVYGEKTAFKIEDYINGFLVTQGIRKAYLIQNFSDLSIKSDGFSYFTRISNLKRIFPNLTSFTNNNYTFFSLKQLNLNDVDTNEKISNLLGYKSSCKFDDIDRTKTTYSFSIDAITNKSQTIDILTFVVPDMTTKSYAEELTKRIRESILNDPKLQSRILDVQLNVHVHDSIDSLKDKIANPQYTITEKDKDQIKGDLIFNIANPDMTEQIFKHIEFDNPVHRGLLLSFIATYKYTTLEPFFPIQSSGAYQEILEITKKHFTYVSELFKETSVRPTAPSCPSSNNMTAIAE